MYRWSEVCCLVNRTNVHREMWLTTSIERTTTDSQNLFFIANPKVIDFEMKIMKSEQA